MPVMRPLENQACEALSVLQAQVREVNSPPSLSITHLPLVICQARVEDEDPGP
jgi:hypothetical protein